MVPGDSGSYPSGLPRTRPAALPCLRVGHPASDLEAYCPAQRYVFITAWNPASEPHSDKANETADALMVAQLDAIGLQRHAAWSECPEGEWREQIGRAHV